MENKLPKVFANPFNKKLTNTQEIFYSRSTPEVNKRYTLNDIIKKINNIFNSSNHVFKSKVLITTSKGVNEEILIGKTPNSILTMDGKIINLKEIIDIEKK